MTSSPTIAIDQFFPYPPARVWQALTDPDLLARWLMPNDFQLKIGHRFTFQGTPMPKVHFSGIVQCEVLAFEIERTLSYSWADHSGENDLRSTVTWRLEPEEQGTHLFLEHGGFDPAHPLLQLSYQIMSGGWVRLMRQFGETLEAFDAVPPSTNK
ncbi:MAG TPA: SRPBCC domain-containing protein [Ktedonobacteraceae bacterium]|nr:SRPBCC domain-containing protein [Ktedonobacteraceae bacterium]